MASDLAQRLRMRLNKADGMSNLASAVQQYYYVNGRPYSFKDHEWQKEVIDDPSLRVSVMKCSQVGASEALLAKVLTMMMVLSNIRTIYTMPTDKMATSFSKDRIDGAINQSPLLRDAVVTANNSASQKQIGSNVLYVNGSFGYNAGISIPATMLVNDEIDSSNPEVIGLMSSRLRHAEITDDFGHRGIHYKFSTPTTEGSPLHVAFMEGTQKHYACKCEHCEKWTVVDFFRDFHVPGFDRDMKDYSRESVTSSEIDLTKAQILCEFCRRDLFPSLLNPDRRQWIAKHPDRPTASYAVAPWDLPKYNTPYTIANQVTDYALKADYYNQVLGLPYSDNSNSFSVSEEHKLRVKQVTPLYHPGPLPPNGSYMMGLDVGVVSHLSIGKVEDGKLKIVLLKTILNERENPATPQILAIYDFFRCVGGVIDSGPDITLVRELTSMREGIKACVYVSNMKGPDVYKEGRDNRTINADRTKSLTLLMDKHNEGNILYPMDDDMTNTAFRHISTTKKVRRQNADGSSSELFIASSREDHYLHSIHYLNICAELRYGELGDSGIPAPITVGRARLGEDLDVEDDFRNRFVW